MRYPAPLLAGVLAALTRRQMTGRSSAPPGRRGFENFREPSLDTALDRQAVYGKAEGPPAIHAQPLAVVQLERNANGVANTEPQIPMQEPDNCQSNQPRVRNPSVRPSAGRCDLREVMVGQHIVGPLAWRHDYK